MWLYLVLMNGCKLAKKEKESIYAFFALNYYDSKKEKISG